MALLYEVRAGNHRLVTALNLDDAPLEHDVAAISEVLAGVARLDGSAVTVAPHGWAGLSCPDRQCGEVGPMHLLATIIANRSFDVESDACDVNFDCSGWSKSGAAV